jgi:hypothetical protein
MRPHKPQIQHFVIYRLSQFIANLRTKKGRQNKSVAQWQFLGVFMGVLSVLASSWEFFEKSWEFLGV